MTSYMFLEQLKKRLGFLPPEVLERTIASYEDKLLNASSADEEDAILKSFGSVDSIVEKYESEIDITDMFCTTQAELSALSATGNISNIINSKVSTDKSATNFFEDNDIIIKKRNPLALEELTKTYSNTDSIENINENIKIDNLSSISNHRKKNIKNEDLFIPSPEGDQSDYNLLTKVDNIDDKQQKLIIPERESLFVTINKKLNISKSVAPYVFAFLVVLVIPVLAIITVTLFAVYLIAFIGLILAALIVLVVGTAFLGLGVAGLSYGIVKLFKIVPIGLLEIGLATISFAFAIAIYAIMYQIIAGVIPKAAKWITKYYVYFLKMVMNLCFGSGLKKS